MSDWMARDGMIDTTAARHAGQLTPAFWNNRVRDKWRDVEDKERTLIHRV